MNDLDYQLSVCAHRVEVNVKGSQLVATLFFFWTGSLFISSPRLVSKPQGSFGLCIPSSGIIGVHCYAQLFRGAGGHRGSELRSTRLHDKHFTD